MAFIANSRYAETVTVETRDLAGRTVTFVRLRTLGSPTSDAQRITPRQSLDLLAQQRYGDATMFWHIADANTALHSADLLIRPTADRPVVINFPRSA